MVKGEGVVVVGRGGAGFDNTILSNRETFGVNARLNVVVYRPVLVWLAGKRLDCFVPRCTQKTHSKAWET